MNIKEISIEVENGNNVDISLERRNVTTDMSLVEKAYSDYTFTYNQNTGKLELTLIANDKRAKTIEVDLPTEELVKDISYDKYNKEIDIKWQNGKNYKISLKELIDVYKADGVTLILDEKTNTFRINEEYLTASNIKVDPKKANVQATNVESAIKELKDDIQETANEIKDGVVTGIKGSSENEYRKGQVEITKENIGLGNVLNVGAYSKEESDNKYQVQGDYATRSEIPTTLPASDVYSWAKEPIKPSYNKQEIGLGNVDNTSDIDKPISTDVQNALDLKEDKANLKALAYKDSLNKSDVGLDKVNNVGITEQEVGQINTNKTDIATLNQKVGNLTGSFQFKGELGSIEELPTASSSNAGYVYIVGNLEYVSDGLKWIELGDEGSFVLKTTYESHLNTQKGKDDAQNTEIAKKVDKSEYENKVSQIEGTLNNKANKSELFSKDYNDLSNKPTIPTKLSELEQDVELGVSEEDVMDIVENNAEQTDTLEVEDANEIPIGTSETFDGTSDNQIPTSKAIDTFYAKKGETSSVHHFELSSDILKNSEWIRFAKVEDVAKNSSGIITINLYGKKDREVILTTSVFNASCGIDNSGKFISDVLPLTQTPELGSAGSGDGSSLGSDTGSGESGTYGLTAIKFERFKNEVYIIGLINYPATGDYESLIVDLKIENNLNFKPLEELEITYIDATEESTGPLLEGATLGAGTSYEFILGMNLGTYITNTVTNAPEGKKTFIDFTLNDGTINIFKYEQVSSSAGSVEVPNSSGSTFNKYEHIVNYQIAQETIDLSSNFSVLGVERNLVALITGIMCFPVSRPYVTHITKLAGTITVELSGGTGSGAYTLYINGEEKAFVGEDSATVSYSFTDLYLGNSEMTIVGSGAGVNIYFDVDLENTDFEIVVPYSPRENIIVNNYFIENNNIFNIGLKVKSIDIHETTSSYELFSVYNKVEQIDELNKGFLDLSKSKVPTIEIGDLLEDSTLTIDQLLMNINHLGGKEWQWTLITTYTGIGFIYYGLVFGSSYAIKYYDLKNLKITDSSTAEYGAVDISMTFADFVANHSKPLVEFELPDNVVTKGENGEIILQEEGESTTIFPGSVTVKDSNGEIRISADESYFPNLRAGEFYSVSYTEFNEIFSSGIGADEIYAEHIEVYGSIDTYSDIDVEGDLHCHSWLYVGNILASDNKNAIEFDGGYTTGIFLKSNSSTIALSNYAMSNDADAYHELTFPDTSEDGSYDGYQWDLPAKSGEIALKSDVVFYQHDVFLSTNTSTTPLYAFVTIISTSDKKITKDNLHSEIGGISKGCSGNYGAKIIHSCRTYSDPQKIVFEVWSADSGKTTQEIEWTSLVIDDVVRYIER